MPSEQIDEALDTESTVEDNTSTLIHPPTPMGFWAFLRAKEHWRWWLIYAIGSYLVLFEKIKYLEVYKHYRVNWISIWESWHIAMMNGKVGAPSQYRILTTLLAECLQPFGISAFVSYLLIRFFCTLATCIVLHWFWRRWLHDTECFFGVMLFLLYYSMSLLGLIQPSEPLNILFFAICITLLQHRKWLPFYICLFIGAFNKLTLVFLAPLAFFFLFIDAPQRNRKVFLTSGLHAVCIFALVLTARFLVIAQVGQKKYATTLWKWQENLDWFTVSPAPWNVIPVALIPMVIIWFTWKKQPKMVQAHGLMLPLFSIGHFAISLLAEIRTFIVTLCLSIPALIIWLRTDNTSSPTSPSSVENRHPQS